MTVPPSEAARELLARRRGRSSLEGFTTYTKPDYQVNWHHKVGFSYLDRWVAGDIKRLILCEPPRHGKSERVSRRLPAYIFGRNPNARVIAASYSADLAAMLNRDVQRIIDSPEYHNLFPNTRLNLKNVKSDAQGSYLKNSEIFEIVGYTGYYRSVGRGGGVTGMGGDFIIVDDPIKNKEEALSETIRDNTWNWYTSTLRTRAEKDARVLITVTRWHLDDLVGRLLDLQATDKTADQWFVLVFPAQRDDDLVRRIYGDAVADRMAKLEQRAEGEALWPEKYDLQALAALRAPSEDDYSALFQQSPIPPGGRMFSREYFKIVPKPPIRAIRVRYWDKAGTEGGGKYTAGVLMSFDGSRFYVEDVVRKQVAANEREALIKATTALDYARYGKTFLGEGILPYAVWIEREGGSGGKESAEHSVINLAGYPVFTEPAQGSKEIRAVPFATQAKAGNVAIVEGEWVADYIRELEGFPRGKYSDQVDGSSGSFNKLALGWDTEEQVVDESRVEISPY